MLANNVLDTNRIRNQVGGEVSIERSEGFRRAGGKRKPMWPSGRTRTMPPVETPARAGSSIGIMRDVDQVGPTPIKPGELLGGRHRPKNKQVMRPTTELQPVRVALPRMRFSSSV